MSGQRMNINEIAKLAGVSRATVSRYLNDGYVSVQKKQVLARVIEETGYVPSTQAQTLRSRKSKIIGVILPRLNSDAISREMTGISSVLSREGYQILLANTANNERKELDYIRTFRNNQVDGLILIATVFTAQHRELLKEMGIPVVILGQNVKGFPCVYHDDYSAAKEITGLLIREGRKNIGYIGVMLKDEAAGGGRYHGYMDAFQAEKVRINEKAMVEAEFNMEDGYYKARELFRRFPELDGLFCATDSIAVGAMEYLKEAGYMIPRDISVTGVGHTSLSKAVSPKLTTIHYYYETSGEEAAGLLMEMLKGEDEEGRSIKMGYEMIRRGTTR